MNTKRKYHDLPDLGKFQSVENVRSYNGNSIANQFIVRFEKGQIFQSYDSIIVVRCNYKIYIGQDRAVSTSTSKYRSSFLGETKKETQAKIDSGEYLLLNI